MKTFLGKMIGVVCILAVCLMIEIPFAPERAHSSYDEGGCVRVVTNYTDGSTSLSYTGFHGHSSSHTDEYHSGELGSSLLHTDHSTRYVVEGSPTVSEG